MSPVELASPSYSLAESSENVVFFYRSVGLWERMVICFKNACSARSIETKGYYKVTYCTYSILLYNVNVLFL